MYGAIRTELLRKQTNSAEQQKEFQKLKNEVEILKVRLDPLLSMMNKRLADMFHESDDRYRLDTLIEKYRVDPDRLTDDELNRLIRGVYTTYERVKRGGRDEDSAKALAATLYLALLDGQRNLRRLMREQARSADGQEAPWWKRLWRTWLTWTNG